MSRYICFDFFHVHFKNVYACACDCNFKLCYISDRSVFSTPATPRGKPDAPSTAACAGWLTDAQPVFLDFGWTFLFMGTTRAEILNRVYLTQLPNTAPLVMTISGWTGGFRLVIFWTDSAYSPRFFLSIGAAYIVMSALYTTPQSVLFRRLRPSYSRHFGLTSTYYLGVGVLSHDRPSHHWQQTARIGRSG